MHCSLATFYQRCNSCHNRLLLGILSSFYSFNNYCLVFCLELAWGANHIIPHEGGYITPFYHQLEDRCLISTSYAMHARRVNSGVTSGWLLVSNFQPITF